MENDTLEDILADPAEFGEILHGKDEEAEPTPAKATEEPEVEIVEDESDEPAPQQPQESPVPEPNAEKAPAAQPEKKAEEPLIFGKFKSLEEAEKAYQNSVSWATKEAQRRAALERELAEKQAQGAPKEPAEEKLIEDLTNGRGVETIKEIALTAVSKAAQEQQVLAQARENQRIADRNAQWVELLEVYPSLKDIEPIVVELDRQYPEASLPRLIRAAREMRQQSTETKTTVDVQQAKREGAKEGAKKAIEAITGSAKPQVEATGRAMPAKSPLKMTKTEAAFAKFFDEDPAEYARWKKK